MAETSAGREDGTEGEAAKRMGVGERWVGKLLRRMKNRGDAVVVHGLQDRHLPQTAAKTQKEVLVILRGPDWHDFVPTFAAEKLGRLPSIQVSKERCATG